eukprot:scaffold1628_cov407-Prasinococcus_capsulatus_cf.AAC.20
MAAPLVADKILTPCPWQPQVWLNNDKQYPWVVLVPQQNNLKEIHDLSYDDQHTLLDEITLCSKAIEKASPP